MRNTHPFKVFESNFINNVFVWFNFIVWFAVTPKAIPVTKEKVWQRMSLKVSQLSNLTALEQKLFSLFKTAWVLLWFETQVWNRTMRENNGLILSFYSLGSWTWWRWWTKAIDDSYSDNKNLQLLYPLLYRHHDDNVKSDMSHMESKRMSIATTQLHNPLN